DGWNPVYRLWIGIWPRRQDWPGKPRWPDRTATLSGEEEKGMKQKLVYTEVESFPISSLSVAGDFNGWNKEADPFYKNEEGTWEAEVEFPPCQSLYKLVVNGELTLN